MIPNDYKSVTYVSELSELVTLLYQILSIFNFCIQILSGRIPHFIQSTDANPQFYGQDLKVIAST